MTAPLKLDPPVYYGSQSISEDDIAAVAESLTTPMITMGPRILAFEKDFAAATRAPAAIGVANGTAALYVALSAAGVGQGDRIIAPAMTFVATANAARLCGARESFVDIDPDTWNISMAKLEEALASAHADGDPIKAILPVHFAGLPCDMPAIRALADQYDTLVIEDGCQALGGKVGDHPIGSCSHSDACTFSFHPVKTITTAEGGMVTLHNPDQIETAQRLRAHGISRSTPESAQEPWRAEMVEEGFNFRLNELQAALGISQLARMADFLAHRAVLAGIYQDKLVGSPIVLQHQTPDMTSAHHLAVCCIDFDRAGINKLAFHQAMKEAGVNLSQHYLPLPMHRFYQARGHNPQDYPVARRYYNQSFTLPLHHKLSTEDVEKVCEVLLYTYESLKGTS